MLYSVKHTTVYTYTDLVPLCHNLAILSPRNTISQQCREFQFDITPVPEVVEVYDDFFGNKVYYFVVEQEHKELTVTASSVIESTPPQWKQSGISQLSWESVKNSLDTGLVNSEIRQYAFSTGITEATPSIKSYAQKSFTVGRPLYEVALELTGRIYEDFKYTAGFTTISTPLVVVMREKKGVCQDFAHLAIACLQSMGMAARYVSGYLETLPPPGKPKLVGSDASHAWISVYIPGMGWVDFDPTNNKHPDEQYITIGWGRNYFDVVPLRGVIQSSHKHELDVSVDVMRLSE
ncbi:MAG: transglutaminase family protein [Niabella sp.]